MLALISLIASLVASPAAERWRADARLPSRRAGCLCSHIPVLKSTQGTCKLASPHHGKPINIHLGSFV